MKVKSGSVWTSRQIKYIHTTDTMLFVTWSPHNQNTGCTVQMVWEKCWYLLHHSKDEVGTELFPYCVINIFLLHRPRYLNADKLWLWRWSWERTFLFHAYSSMQWIPEANACIVQVCASRSPNWLCMSIHLPQAGVCLAPGAATLNQGIG